MDYWYILAVIVSFGFGVFVGANLTFMLRGEIEKKKRARQAEHRTEPLMSRDEYMATVEKWRQRAEPRQKGDLQ